jgi:hypothetical protein
MVATIPANLGRASVQPCRGLASWEGPLGPRRRARGGLRAPVWNHNKDLSAFLTTKPTDVNVVKRQNAASAPVSGTCVRTPVR